MIDWRRFDDDAAFAAAVADDVAAIIDDALAARGAALIALSGGSSPFPIYDRLLSLVSDWHAVTIVPVDDRLVPQSSDLSNIAALDRTFARSGAKLMALADATGKAGAEAEANARLDALPWPPDLVWLGMGSDGHFASIFPGPDFDRAFAPSGRRRAVAVTPDPPPPEAPVDRITLAAPAIAEARRLILTLSGEAKADRLDRGLAASMEKKPPVARFLAEFARPITIYRRP